MKKFLIGFVLVQIFSAAQAVSAGQSEGWDGCYQLVTEGVMYPMICLQGTSGVELGGSGVKMFVFHTNTLQINTCFLSSSLSIWENELVFEKDGRNELVLTVKEFTTDGFARSGDALVGRTLLKFVKFNDHTASVYFEEITKAGSDICR